MRDEVWTKRAKCQVSLGDLHLDIESDQWLELRAKDGSVAGRVHLNLLVSEREDSNDSEPFDLAKFLDEMGDVDENVQEIANPPLDSPVQISAARQDLYPCVTVRIVEAKNLPVLSGDVFCSAKIAGHRSVLTTQATNSTLPQWGESKDFHLHHLVGSELTIELHEIDDSGKRTVIGKGSYMLEALGDQFNDWIQLDNHSEVRFEISIGNCDRFSEDENVEIVEEGQDELEPQHSEEEKHEAKELKKLRTKKERVDALLVGMKQSPDEIRRRARQRADKIYGELNEALHAGLLAHPLYKRNTERIIYENRAVLSRISRDKGDRKMGESVENGKVDEAIKECNDGLTKDK
jgi:hypothetical protein